MCYYENEIHKSVDFARTALRHLFEHSRCPTTQHDPQNWINYNPLNMFALTKTLQWYQKWHNNTTETLILTDRQSPDLCESYKDSDKVLESIWGFALKERKGGDNIYSSPR
ncbi:hypothetical protein CEXT_81821 [Caerostris extrusa]|uniref:Uncharacterized protein n=1 Tax=Caerostris extrusa TaxID=172846 RepID=A0AAV4WZV3_CAEEX|nr:hypothetical protein CEXT_81821 [Caerostris extrusa]